MACAGIGLIACSLACASCKTDPPDNAKPAPVASTSPPPAVAPPRTAPALTPPDAPAPDAPAPDAPVADDKQVAPIDEARVTELAPVVPGATALEPLTFAGDRATQSWCLPAQPATDSAIKVATALFKRGWNVDESRGDPAKTGVFASQDGTDVQVTMGGVDSRCANGVVAAAVYRAAR